MKKKKLVYLFIISTFLLSPFVSNVFAEGNQNLAVKVVVNDEGNGRHGNHGTKHFILLNDDNSDSNIQFSSRQPRGAALKAASRGNTLIKLREKGTNRVYVFTKGYKLSKDELDLSKWFPEDKWKVKYRKFKWKKSK